MPQPTPPIALDLSAFASLSIDEMRLSARTAGQEVWEQVDDGDAYACADFPGLVLTRHEARQRFRTLLVHTTDDLLDAARSEELTSLL